MMTQSAVDDNFFFIIAYSSLFLSARDLLPVEDKRGVTREKVSPGNTGALACNAACFSAAPIGGYSEKRNASGLFAFHAHAG
jgi:hypothetical protein